MSTYAQKAQDVRSEKVILCTVDATERFYLFTLDSGSVYYRDVDHYVINAFAGSTALNQGSSSSLNSGEFYFDPELMRLFVRMSDDSNPSANDVHATYRFFFSSKSIVLPFDLTIGSAEVDWDGVLIDGSDISQALDIDQTGLALENNIKVTLENTHGYFDEIFDTLIFENKTVNFYYWFSDISPEEAQRVFTGFVVDKSFSSTRVSFQCKDNIYKLRSNVVYNKFEESDGFVKEEYLNKPKRRIYGQANDVRCVPINAVNDGYSFDQKISSIKITVDSSTIEQTGTGDFLEELSPEDRLIIPVGDEEITLNIDSVTSTTEAEIGSEAEFNSVTTEARIIPNIPYRGFNREWNVSGHKLRENATTIVSVIQNNRIQVADPTDFEANDLIIVGSETIFIKRVVNDIIVLKQAMQLGQTVGASVTKPPIQRVFRGNDEFFYIRDFTYQNINKGCKIIFNDLAEFNSAGILSVLGDFTFTNGSRTVAVANKDIENILKPRDWIINGTDLSHQVFYEVLDVNDGEVLLRTAYSGSTQTTSAKYKSPVYFDDESIITANVLGLEYNGAWAKRAGSVIRHLIENDADITETVDASFDTADEQAPHTISLVSPEQIGGQEETIRDIINKVNNSVFGSLVNNQEFKLQYKVLDSEKPDTLETIKDDDIISWSSKTRNKIVSQVVSRYSHGEDRFTGERKFSSYTFENDFVEKYVGIANNVEQDIYIFEENSAQVLTQRYAFFNSLSNSVITVTTKTNLILSNLNDKVWLSLDRLFKRFGNRDRQKISIIQSIKKDGSNTRLELADLGNSFNRVPSISADTADDFSTASDDEKLKNGYILDDTTCLPDASPSEDKQLGANLIG